MRCRPTTTRFARFPGVGDYTAAAIAVFAFGRRHAVLDTNVRRVLARSVSGVEFPPAALTRGERDLATGLLPDDDTDAATWSIALMELGALVCTASRRAAEPARSRTGVRGGPPASRRTTDRRAAARPGPGPTGSVGAG